MVARCDGDRIDVRVDDAGAWLEPAAGRRTDRGRGLAIARALVDEVVLDRRGRGTAVRLRRRVGRAEPPTRPVRLLAAERVT